MGKTLTWLSRLSVIALLPACAAPAIGPALLPSAPRMQTVTKDPIGTLSVTRVATVPAAVEQAYAAAVKETVATYKADSDITSVTIAGLRPAIRLAQSGSSPVYIMTAVGNLLGKVDRDTVATAFTAGFAFDEAGRDTGFASSFFVDSVLPRPKARRSLKAAKPTPWDFEYMSKVPGGLNVALDLLHNRQMDDLSTMYPDMHRQALKPTPGPGRIVAIRHKDQVVGYIESLSATMWQKDQTRAKGIEVVNVFDPQGAMIQAEGRYLDPEAAANHKLFQFERYPLSR
jgi:hypothetical protein